MTDLELLERAAKAAGYTLREHYTGFPPIAVEINAAWNPLTDDGDALRLAVKCLPFYVLKYSKEDYDYCNKNGLAATRRAIVRAVAELGK